MALRVGLAHTEIKLRRAYKHLEELKRVVAEFGKDAYTITRKDDPRQGVHQARIELSIAPDPLGGLPGEFAYSLRSSLDHLAWQLALLTTDTPNDWTCFPIYETRPKGAPKSRYWESVGNIPPEAATIIDKLQPHHRGTAFKNDLLWQLNKLCNIDKHQAIAVSSTSINVRPSGITQVWQKAFNNAIQITVPLAEKEQLQLDVSVAKIIFGEPIDTVNAKSDFEIGIERFEEIYNFVRDIVVPQFKQFF